MRLFGDRVLFPGNWLWCAIGLVFAIDTVWLAASERLSIVVMPVVVVAVMAGLALVIGLRKGSLAAWVRDASVGASFIMLAFVGLKILDYLLMSTRVPLADDLLDSWDRAVGFDWLAYATAIAAHPWLAQTLRLSYLSLTQLTIVLFAALFYLKGAARAAEYVRLFFVCAAASTIIGAFFPCIGVMIRYASPELAAAFGTGAGTYYIQPLEALRSTAPYQLDLREMPGLVEFPSFHTASAILVAYVCRGLRALSWVAILYAVALVASTPLMGGHYFVDLIAGTLLAASAAAAERYRHRSTQRTALETAQGIITPHASS
jgi:membrane-associated phospholipid phosphatase